MHGPGCAAPPRRSTGPCLAGRAASSCTTCVSPHPLSPRVLTRPTQVSHDHVAHHFFSYAPFCASSLPPLYSRTDVCARRQPARDHEARARRPAGALQLRLHRAPPFPAPCAREVTDARAEHVLRALPLVHAVRVRRRRRARCLLPQPPGRVRARRRVRGGPCSRGRAVGCGCAGCWDEGRGIECKSLGRVSHRRLLARTECSPYICMYT